MSKRILLIDDEEHIRRMVRLTLETAGYEVSEAGDGEAGLAAYGDGTSWDVVLLDQKMPGLDGLEVLRQIKARDAGAPVIMVTAFASIELAVDAMKLGATDFVRKPMTPEIVRGAVTAALQQAAARHPSQPPAPLNAAPAIAASNRPLIETVTLNGFRLLRPSDVGDQTPEQPGERRFIVVSPSGRRQEVIVEINAETVGYVERTTRRRLPPESSFWTVHAENTLAAYLWNERRTPPGGWLQMKDVGRDDLETAARWKDD